MCNFYIDLVKKNSVAFILLCSSFFGKETYFYSFLGKKKNES